MKKHKPIFRELPISKVERDSNQPRTNFGTNGDENRLLSSIKDYGIEEPLKVSQIEENRYIIIDGHRRYICAQKLRLEVVPCRIYPKMGQGEFEARRYEIQNNRRPWRPMERSEALNRIKMSMGFRTNREVADFVHLSEALVSYSLLLRNQRVAFTGLMEKYDLNESYRFEFMRLNPKLRKIREFEVDDIVNIILEKVEHKVIKNSKDFRKLGRIFLRASTNEVSLHRFLSNPDMTIGELEGRSTQTGLALLVEQLTAQIATKKKNGVSFSKEEKSALGLLGGLLEKAL